MKAKLSLITTLGLMACTLAGIAQNNSADQSSAATPAAAVEPATQPAASGDGAVKTEGVTDAATTAVPADAAAATTDSSAPATITPAATGEGAAAPVAAPVEDQTSSSKEQASQDPAFSAIPATPAAAPATATPAAEAPVAEAPAATTIDTAASPSTVAANNAPVPATTPATTPANAQSSIIPLIVMDDVPLTDAIKNLARQAGLNYMLDPKIGFGQPGPDGKIVAQPSVSIRWENITAEQALNAMLNNYSLQLVEDPKTKIARVTTKDPAAPDPLVTRIIQLKYASTSNMVSAVQTALVDKRSKVTADVRTSQLVILATEKEITEVDNLVDKLDTITKQVLIEARLLETSLNPKTGKGIDWSGTLQAQHLAFGNNLQANSAPAALNNTLSQSLPKMLLDTAKGFNPATAFLDADGVNAVFAFLNQNAEARVLSSPRTVTLDNQTAKIEVTRASPIINVTPGTANTTGGSQITYTNLGITLKVTPRISANNYVNLTVLPEVSRIFDTVTRSVNNGIFQADEYDIRKIETSVMIPSGNTLVLGGLVQDDVRNSDTKVPILGDIPLLKLAFHSTAKSRQKSDLMVFITPTIIKDTDFQPTKSDYLKTPVPTSDSVDGNWSAWDSGKPADWSKTGKSKSN